MPGAELHFGSMEMAPDRVDQLARLLAADELARAARFVFARDRRRFIVRRASLRTTLAAATGIAPERLVYTGNAYGKPALAGGGPCFSASHSGERWVVALGDRSLGVDIERHDPAIDWRDLTASLFGPNERRALEALPAEDVLRGFFDCWARKEAFVKAIGMGLSYPLDAFEVSVSPEARFLGGADGWAITEVALTDGFSAALVMADDGAPIAVTLRPEAASVEDAAHNGHRA